MFIPAIQMHLLNLRFQPFIGEQFAQSEHPAPHDALSDTFEVSAPIHVESSKGLNQRKKGSCRFTALFTSDEEPIFSADRERMDCSSKRA